MKVIPNLDKLCTSLQKYLAVFAFRNETDYNSWSAKI